MVLYQVLLLAIVQGVTEFLPVSSSGHLALLGQWRGFADQGLAFDAAIHLGTLAAIIWYARADVVSICKSLLSKPVGHNRQLPMLLLIATLPVLICGWLLVGWIEGSLRNIVVIATTTLVFGLLLGLADSFGVRKKSIQDLRLPTALWIGLAQVLALLPGTSRSGITMTAGLALGMSRQQAAHFSFLLAIPVLAVAGGYNLLRIAMHPQEQLVALPVMLLATVLSGSVAFASIKLFLHLVERIGMWPFAVYRILLALLLFWLI